MLEPTQLLLRNGLKNTHTTGSLTLRGLLISFSVDLVSCGKILEIGSSFLMVTRKTTNEAGPPLHHYRSYSVKEEQEYVTQCWNKTIEQKVKLPHCNPRIYSDTDNLLFLYSKTMCRQRWQWRYMQPWCWTDWWLRSHWQTRNERTNHRSSEQNYSTSLGKELASVLGNSTTIKSLTVSETTSRNNSLSRWARNLSMRKSLPLYKLN